MNPIRHAPSFLTLDHHSLAARLLLLVGSVAIWALPALALDGQVGIHDPSTLMLCDGKWYTYGTGGTPLVSDDGWTWRAGTRASRSGAAPDVIHVGDRYFHIRFLTAPSMIWTKSLDPNSPDYKWEDVGNVFGMEGQGDFCNADRSGSLSRSHDGKLWLTYGSYFGYTRVVELDPKTGQAR